nr:immunoglobulin heavy chain junction region [Macaca mulatta]MOV38771.1 immunoglobulin heavy chain junction region [Macaca mulatta]MOV40385.1 immunoglobulin heavy chain junction region [Macaca mulatta]MOV40509.1 immunoglobulin heavy chain junction region [Macaca mulatta]MOV40874.1 immunoglobulin heavy chain junction region [Macaca mulatta]
CARAVIVAAGTRYWYFDLW